VEHAALAAVLEDMWRGTLRRHPTWGSDLGDPAYDELAYDGSAEARAAHRAEEDRWLARLDALTGLTGNDATTAALARAELVADIEQRVCRFEHWDISPRSHPLTDASWLVQGTKVADREDADQLFNRLSAAAVNVDHTIADLRVGLADGLVANAESVRRVVAMLDDEVGGPLEDSPLLADLSALPDDHREAARTANEAVVRDALRPALARLRDVLRDEILPVAREGADASLAGLPLGDACYEALIERYTTLPLSADELHQTGLDELASIHAEFESLGTSLWGLSDRDAIFERLRTDPALRFDTAEAVEATAREALARAEAAVPAAFGTLPVTECKVRPIPDYLAPYTTIAYYERPKPGQGLPGFYAVNTYQPETRPRHEAEVLAFHEAVPGHHLQIALNMELDGLPAFRRNGQFTAFVEGWALYTERLSDELGLYSGDIDRMGMLSFDAWRAARLVVDTGLHAKGWSREQAIEFLTDNTPLALNNIDNEVDRYLTTPGQALAYKTGQLHILRLRAEAEAELGDAFDLSGFHDVVLGGGGVTLPVLEERVKAWVEAQQAP
jgi:uncharacterized protein (DUF885 family)